MASTPPPVPPAPVATPQPPAPKKTSPWVWVGVGCGALLLIVVLVFVVGGLILFKKGKEFVETAEKNPAVTVAKVATALDPNIEVVDSDDKAGTVTLRNKKTGETITLNAEDIDIRKGRLKFTNEKGEEVTVEASPEQRKVRISSKEREVVFGEVAGELPGWVPLYPGAKPSRGLGSKGEGGTGGLAEFTTSDAPDRVMAFYEREMKARGFSPNTSRFEQNGNLVGGLVQGKNAQGQQLMVTVTVEEGRTGIAINYEGK